MHKKAPLSPLVFFTTVEAQVHFSFLPSLGEESARGPGPRPPHSPFFGGIGLWGQEVRFAYSSRSAGRVSPSKTPDPLHYRT